VPCQGRSSVASRRDGLRPTLDTPAPTAQKLRIGKSRKNWPRERGDGWGRERGLWPLSIARGNAASFRFRSVGWMAGVGRPSRVELRRSGRMVGLGCPSRPRIATGTAQESHCPTAIPVRQDLPKRAATATRCARRRIACPRQPLSTPPIPAPQASPSELLSESPRPTAPRRAVSRVAASGGAGSARGSEPRRAVSRVRRIRRRRVCSSEPAKRAAPEPPRLTPQGLPREAIAKPLTQRGRASPAVGPVQESRDPSRRTQRGWPSPSEPSEPIRLISQVSRRGAPPIPVYR
jgi:hypothetical protein